MVCLRLTHECQTGKHKKCKGNYSAPEGQYGGLICTCRCHKPDPFKNVELPTELKEHEHFTILVPLKTPKKKARRK